MSMLPDIVREALDDRKGPAIFTTVSKAGIPNSVYIGFVHKSGKDKLVVVDNFFHKTQENIFAGSKASLLFITNEGKAFQLKGSVDYQTGGEIYDDMKNNWLDAKYPGHAAVVLNAEEVFSGAEQLL